MEEELNHFSHEEHPLILSQLWKKHDGEVDQKLVICYGCQKQISDSTAYCCFHCDFFLHKRCAELSHKIAHPIHPQHPLILHRQPTNSSHGCMCDLCGQKGWKFFIYKCSLCHFELDVSCATLDWEIKLECHDHPVIEQRSATFHCNACCMVGEDSSYLCTVCPFWIHMRCALLPVTVQHKDHNHPLLLAYSVPSEHRSFRQYCPVCHGKIHRHYWVYYCGPCRCFVHIKCIMISQSTKQKSGDKYSILEGELDLEDQCTTKKNVVKLPSSHAAQELISHLLNKTDESGSSSGELKAEEKIFIEEHQHPVILSKREQIQDENNGTKEEAITLVCDWCIEAISLSDLHYSCVECGYYVHFTCYKLPSELQITKHPEHPLLLRYEANAVGHFICNACQRQSNGEFYECDRDSCELRFCIKCASASMIPNVAHAAHKHLLTQYGSSDPTKCNACGTKSDGFVFACKYCHFYLDYECALLPPATKQRWDKHPLILVYPPYFDHPEEFYCVLCEEEINPNTWMYHCRDCDYSLHPWCIPQIKLFRDLKFGRSLLVGDHPHHLTHVPEARYKSFCEACKESLDWKESFKCNSQLLPMLRLCFREGIVINSVTIICSVSCVCRLV